MLPCESRLGGRRWRYVLYRHACCLPRRIARARCPSCSTTAPRCCRLLDRCGRARRGPHRECRFCLLGRGLGKELAPLPHESFGQGYLSLAPFNLHGCRVDAGTAAGDTIAGCKNGDLRFVGPRERCDRCGAVGFPGGSTHFQRRDQGGEPLEPFLGGLIDWAAILVLALILADSSVNYVSRAVNGHGGCGYNLV